MSKDLNFFFRCREGSFLYIYLKFGRAAGPRNCKGFLLKTDIRYTQVPFETGFTVCTNITAECRKQT